MGFLSKLFRCFLDPEGGRRERRCNVELEASARSADSTQKLQFAQSLRDFPSKTLSAISATFPGRNKNVALIPVANRRLIYTNRPPLSSQNSRELELQKFRHEIDKWKEWKRSHPDRSWIHAVKDTANENSPFLEALPDGIIPIRGLVKSLIYTCKQAADFALAKEEVFPFMEEIDGWLDIVCAIKFGSGNDAWEVLDEIRDLIGIVIIWSSQLEVVSSQRLYVQRSIQGFRERFAEISMRFGVISDIKLLQGVDNVTNTIRKHNVNFKRMEFLKQQLQPRSIVNASYNDQNKQPCDPETRLEILEEVKSWIKDVSKKSPCFYWLSGAPGVGKSAITASIAKNCLDLGILGAQFFINRNDATTTDPRTLFPTICWRLCERFPRTVAVAMENALRAHPTLVDDISADQAIQLFVNAIESAAATDRSKAVVIVIDALDETDTKRLRDIAQIFSKVVADLPQNAKFFISSRAEDAITKPFNSLRLHKRVKSRYLGPEHSTTDVSRFLEKEIKKILEDYEINWDDFEDEMMKTLSSQAAGLFIWAQTALNSLRDEIQHNGEACFVGLLDVLKTDGMNDINMLYLTILRRTCKDDDWEYERFHRIIGAILVRQTPLSIADIAGLLDLKEPRNSQPVDLVHFVRQYRTVLVNDTRDINDGVVPRVHRSFADFITSERAEKFRIDKRASHRELALRCIGQLENLVEYLKSESEKAVQASFPAQLAYASVHWQTHLTRVVEPDREEQNAYHDDMPESVPENDTQCFPLTANPLDTAEIKRERLFTLAFSPDGTQFAIVHRYDIQIRDARTGLVIMSMTGHKSSVCSVGFSSDGTQLVSGSFDKTARIWNTGSGKVLHVLNGHISDVLHAAFSHDGKTVVTCSLDNTLRTWNSSTGQLLNVFSGHTGTLWYCVFSPNDQRIASRTYRGEIIVWNVNSGELISKFNHDISEMISFCPCGNHLISRDWGGIRLWDVESGEQLDHANSTNARLTFWDDSKQESPHAHVPPALSEPVDSSTPHIYTFKTKIVTVCGIVEHGQDVWVSTISGRRLFFSAGATRME